VIEVRDLSFRYPGATRQTLDGLRFEVAAGEIVGFLGPSGAGKSTTQRILTGLLRGFEGEVRVAGRDLRAWTPDDYNRIGVSFEVPNPYLKLTALENLEYFSALYDGPTEEPRELLARVGLEQDAALLAASFSKGMKVRLCLARALLHRPNVLFLDEPTAGLDPTSARGIKELIRAERAAGRTVFLTTHDMTLADDLSDRVVFLVDGAIRHIDTPRAFKLRHGRRTVRVEYTSDGRRQAEEFPLEGLGDQPAFTRLLRERQIETIHTQETTLEDVFLQLTGRSLA
jgi:fluoroquinolone transport system ATP-binding protein